MNKQVLKNALEEIERGTSIRKSATKYGIDRTTLLRYNNDKQKVKKIEDKGSQYKASQIFTLHEEKLLVNYILTCSKMNYGLTRKAVMKFAYEYAHANSKKIPESWSTNNSAGKDWLRGFRIRNPEV